MATDNNQHQAQHSDVSFEHSDLSHRGIWAFFIFLGVSTAVIFLAIGALYKGFGYAQAKLAPEPNPMAVTQTVPTPDRMQNTAGVDLQKFGANGTQAILQSNEPEDMKQFRAQEELQLNAAPWKDDKGVVHLPIARAMELVSQRNQPARANGTNPSIADPNTVPTEAGFVGHSTISMQADAAAVEGASHGEEKVTPEGESKKLAPEPKTQTPATRALGK